MTKELSLLDFYRKNEISPVRQEIRDLGQHFQRRQALYRQLGFLPVIIRDRTILEVGRGSGNNSLYRASLKPEQFVFCEPNQQGVKDIRNLFDHYHFWSPDIVQDWLSYISQKNTPTMSLLRSIRTGFLGVFQ